MQIYWAIFNWEGTTTRRILIWSWFGLLGIWNDLPEQRMCIGSAMSFGAVGAFPRSSCTFGLSQFNSLYCLIAISIKFDYFNYVTLNTFGKMQLKIKIKKLNSDSKWIENTDSNCRRDFNSNKFWINFQDALMVDGTTNEWLKDGCVCGGCVRERISNKDQIKWAEETNCTTINYA